MNLRIDNSPVMDSDVDILVVVTKMILRVVREDVDKTAYFTVEL